MPTHSLGSIQTRLTRQGYSPSEAKPVAQKILDVLGSSLSVNEKRHAVSMLLDPNQKRLEITKVKAAIDRVFVSVPEPDRKKLFHAVYDLLDRPGMANGIQGTSMPIFARPMEKAFRNDVREWNDALEEAPKALKAQWSLKYNGLLHDVKGMKATQLIEKLGIDEVRSSKILDAFVGPAVYVTGRSPDPALLSGTVRFFNGDKGYGFLKQDNGGEEVFVHISRLADGLRDLADGQKVQFEVTRGRKGLEAKNVRPV